MNQGVNSVIQESVTTIFYVDISFPVCTFLFIFCIIRYLYAGGKPSVEEFVAICVYMEVCPRVGLPTILLLLLKRFLKSYIRTVLDYQIV